MPTRHESKGRMLGSSGSDEAGAAPAVAAGVAALDHEVGHHPVDGEAVVEAALGELPQLARADRRVGELEPDPEGAAHGHHVEPAGDLDPAQELAVPLAAVPGLAGRQRRRHPEAARLVDDRRADRPIGVGSRELDHRLTLRLGRQGERRDQRRAAGVSHGIALP